MFDFFLSEERKIQKHQRCVTNRDKQPDDREISARWLADNGSGKALVALLTRFDMNLEHQLHDKEEKTFVYSLLVNVGDPVLRPLSVHLKKCRQFAMPIRLYEELKGREAAVEMVFELLAYELAKDDFKPEKKTHMLVWLAETKHPRCIEVTAPFLQDFDEGVRCAAAEVILAQADDAGREPLLGILADPKEESNRLKFRLAEVFMQRRWAVGDPESVRPNLPSPYTLNGEYIVTE